MIQKNNNCYMLNTQHTSYVFRVMPGGHLEHLHYGAKVDLTGFTQMAQEKIYYPSGSSVAYDKENWFLSLEDHCQEISTVGKGDFSEPFVELIHADGSTTSDFVFESANISETISAIPGLPSSYDTSGTAQELIITLFDKNAIVHDKKTLKMKLWYRVYEDCDVITRNVSLYNAGENSVKITRLMSNQLMFDECDFSFVHFNGAWAREMNVLRQPITQGKMVNESLTGTSSNKSNPFVMLEKDGCTKDYGECYGMNLVYSGNHYTAVEVNPYGKTRLVQGIQPRLFGYELKEGQEFFAPESVMTYSACGNNKMSQNLHAFVNQHIVRGTWAGKERPVLLNSWEAAYFNINEHKLLSMAKAAAKVGVELFVMDDGWFGKRDNDTCSLGDWTENRKKLPGGIKGLAQKINALGLDFGIWVEPEMVNVDSDCYRNHPDWCLAHPSFAHSEGRNQRVLDITNPKVQDYIIEQMTNVFSTGNISYVKWDMNRNISDYYSPYLQSENISQDEVAHRYVVGLYRIMDTLVKAFPNILFEGCSSGGNRFDLGILCYFPQIWASDDTDAWERTRIQTGYSYAYPPSVVTAHVSSCPNHQTLRMTPLETRFQVAAFGVLGYECNLKEMSKEELEQVAAQIAFYKKYRKTLQYGTYFRIKDGEHTPNQYLNRGDYQWMVVNEDKSEALAFYGQPQCVPNYVFGKMRTKGLDENKIYHFTNRFLKYDIRPFGSLVNAVSPVHIKQGSLLHNTLAHFIKMNGEVEEITTTGRNLNVSGVRLQPKFAGTGYDDKVAFFQDYGSRIYVMEETKEIENKEATEDISIN